MPVAVNCSVPPTSIFAVIEDGVTAIEDNVTSPAVVVTPGDVPVEVEDVAVDVVVVVFGGSGVIVILTGAPVTPPGNEAVISELPAATPVARPAASIVAAAVFELAHET